MAVPKSPFYVVRNFLSGKQCEIIVDNLGFYSPDTDKDGIPLKMMRNHEESEKIVYGKFQPLIKNLEEYYDFVHRGTESMTFEFHSEGVIPEAICDNSKWIKKKWVRTKDRDFSIVLFLCDYQDDLNFDFDYECYGGKLEFLQHKFGFNPERGTLLVYPSSPHFINAFSEIKIGDLFVTRFYLAGQRPYMYQPADFPGNYLSWFDSLK